MRSNGSRFTLGVWGLRVCSLDVAFTVATVRNRPQPFVRTPYGRAYGKFCRGGHFWRFQTCRCFVSRGRRGTSWQSDVFCNVSKVVFCGRRNTQAILLRRFPKMRGSLRGRRNTLDVSIVILRGRRSTLDVWCGVFFANRIGMAASSGDKVQIPWQAWHFVTCAENWRKPRTKHRLWEHRCWGREFSRFLQKLVGKRRFWSYKVWKLDEVSHEMLVLVLARVSSRVSGFPVASPCLWGKLQNMSCGMFQTVKIGGRLARNAGFDVPTCLVSSLLFSCGVAVSMGEAAKPFLFEGFQAGCHVVLRGRRGTLWHSNLFDNVSKISNLEEVSCKMLFFLHPCVLSWVAGFPVASPCLWGQLRTPHSTLYTPRSTIYTLDSTLYTLHSTLYTLHFTLLTLHLRLYTPHSTLYTTLYTLHFPLLTPHSTLYTPHSTLYTPHFTLHTPTLHSTLPTPHFPLHTPHFTL